MWDTIKIPYLGIIRIEEGGRTQNEDPEAKRRNPKQRPRKYFKQNHRRK